MELTCRYEVDNLRYEKNLNTAFWQIYIRLSTNEFAWVDDISRQSD